MLTLCVFGSRRHLNDAYQALVAHGDLPMNRDNSYADALEWIAEFKAARECRFCSVGKSASVCEQPLSVVLVLVYCLPQMSPPAPCRRALPLNVMSEVDIFVSSKRNFNILDHMEELKNNAFRRALKIRPLNVPIRDLQVRRSLETLGTLATRKA